MSSSSWLTCEKRPPPVVVTGAACESASLTTDALAASSQSLGPTHADWVKLTAASARCRSAAQDYGWADSGWHRQDAIGRKEVLTPTMDGLIKQGLELDRHYVSLALPAVEQLSTAAAAASRLSSALIADTCWSAINRRRTSSAGELARRRGRWRLPEFTHHLAALPTGC